MSFYRTFQIFLRLGFITITLLISVVIGSSMFLNPIIDPIYAWGIFLLAITITAVRIYQRERARFLCGVLTSIQYRKQIVSQLACLGLTTIAATFAGGSVIRIVSQLLLDTIKAEWVAIVFSVLAGMLSAFIVGLTINRLWQKITGLTPTSDPR